MKLKPYIFSFKQNWDSFELPESSKLFNCADPSSASFFNDLVKLDQLAFGEQGMGMDRWVLYDCAAMPGAILGYGINKEDYINEFKFLEQFEGDFIALSMFIAIPMLGSSGRWFAHNLSSLGSRFKLKGLGLDTKVLGINTLKIRELYGATQWGSPAIHIHSQLADMHIISSSTPNHTYSNSLTYKSYYEANYRPQKNRRVAEQYDFLLKASDLNKQLELQSEITHGLELQISGRPLIIDGDTQYPMTRK